MSLYDLTTQYGIPNYGEGFGGILALIANNPREYSPAALVSEIRGRDIIPFSEFDFKLGQAAVSRDRLIGEGADPNTIFVQKIELGASFKMPLFAASIGGVTPLFATLWNQTKLAYHGTASAAVAGILDVGAGFGAGQNPLTIDNIADFLSLPAPYSAMISGPGEIAETVVILAASKSARTLTLQSPTQQAHSQDSIIVALPQNVSGFVPAQEPAFSLLSTQEGLISPCLINKMTIGAAAGRDVDIACEISPLGVNRSAQLQFDQSVNGVANYDALIAMAAKEPVLRMVAGGSVMLSPYRAATGVFGLSSALGDPLFSGWQGFGLPDFVVTGISITIDNHLEPIYASHSRKKGGARQRENVFPSALASKGRTVSGKINYRAPYKAWAIAERLAGPSGLNSANGKGGLLIDYGICQISLAELAWSPAENQTATASGDTENSLEFTLVGETRNAMPELGFSTQI